MQLPIVGKYENEKELVFFSTNSEYHKGIGYYEARIHNTSATRSASRAPFGIDVSPAYILSPTSVTRIKLAYPDKEMKFIILIRDPVRRVYSDWNQARGLTGHPWVDATAGYVPFNVTIEKILTGVDFYCPVLGTDMSNSELVNCLIEHAERLAISLYDLAIDMWIDAFAPKHHFFCIVGSEFLFSNMTQAMDVISDFIGLTQFDWNQYKVHANEGEYDSDFDHVEEGVIAKLRAFFRKYGSKYYDIVNIHGYHGCLPDVERQVK